MPNYARRGASQQRRARPPGQHRDPLVESDQQSVSAASLIIDPGPAYTRPAARWLVPCGVRVPGRLVDRSWITVEVPADANPGQAADP